MTAVAYTGAFQDYSGMGEAARQIVAALESVGVVVCGRCERYAPAVNLDFGSAGRAALRACGHRGDYRIEVLHVTPDEFPRLKQDGVFTIGHFFWETDRLPPTFVKGLEVVDEVWTGSQATVDAIRNSGVDKPVFVFPQPTGVGQTDVPPYESSQTEGFNGYMFYSIAEWTDRKNLELLLNAYLAEFRDSESVGLLLKTYFQSFTPQHFAQVHNKATDIVAGYDAPSPPIFLELNPLSYLGIQSVHQRGDCYVSPHRGEGWGIPTVEAMVHGNPVITTSYGGVSEYITDWMNGMKLRHEMVPVTGMEHATRYYCPDQNWADVSEQDLRDKLRYAYDNHEVMVKIGESGRTLVRDRFNYTTVGDMMKARLMTIEASL